MVMDHAAENPTPTRRRRWRRLLHLLWVLPAFVVMWWGIGRWTADGRALRTFEAPVAAAVSGEAVAPSTVTVLAYNIAHGRGLADSNWGAPDRPARLDAIAALIADADADIVVLNEVDFRAAWSGGTNQAQWIAEAAGYPYRVEQRSIDLDLPLFDLKFGNAVLSRFPIVDAQPLELPVHKAWEHIAGGSKQACYVDVQLPGDQTLRVVPVHLEPRAWITRVASARRIANAKDASPHAVVALGDFNSTLPGLPGVPSSQSLTAMSVLTQSGFHTWPHAAPLPADTMTFHAAKPTRVIDWIVIDDRSTFVDYRVLDSTLSDHRPVIATLRLAP